MHIACCNKQIELDSCTVLAGARTFKVQVQQSATGRTPAISTLRETKGCSAPLAAH